MTHDNTTLSIDRDEQRYLMSMFCWNMTIDADIKYRRCVEAGDLDGAQRWHVTRGHYLKNYARLQYSK